MQMEVDIDAKLPKLEKQGKLRALRSISKLGMITYKMFSFSGDNTIKKEVIARYLQTDSDARENGTLAISPTNYKFHEKATIESNGRRTHVFEIKPRKKIVGLFEGELWLDEETGMPVREAGRFVKNPSVFLKKIEFVRVYEIRDGVSYPTNIQSTADVRMFGKAELNIAFSNFTRSEPADLEQEAPEKVQQDVLSRYHSSADAQQKALLSVAMQVEVEGKYPKLGKQARLRVQRDVSPRGAVTYRELDYSGDSAFREVLQAIVPKVDNEGHDRLVPMLSADNYTFKEKGLMDYYGRPTRVFEFKPKNKSGAGLVQGELWLDEQTAMPVREFGKWLKSPSVFVKNLQYVREFEIRDGVAYPKSSQNTAEVRMLGKAEVALSFSNFTKSDNSAVVAVSAYLQ